MNIEHDGKDIEGRDLIRHADKCHVKFGRAGADVITQLPVTGSSSIGSGSNATRGSTSRLQHPPALFVGFSPQILCCSFPGFLPFYAVSAMQYLGPLWQQMRQTRERHS